MGQRTKGRAARLPRPTLVESLIAAVLLAESVWEVVLADDRVDTVAVRVVVGIVPPVLAAFSRSAPVGAATGLALVWLLDAVPGPAQGTIGAGFSMLLIAFGVCAWTARPWPWLALVLVTGTLRDLRMPDADTTDLVMDWVFLSLCALGGRLVHRRSERAAHLDEALRLSATAAASRTREAIDRERAVIARELHDIVAHAVSLMVVQAGTARPRAEAVDPELAQVLQTIESSGRGALTELRQLLGALRAVEGDGLRPVPGLADLDHLVADVRAAGLDVEAHVDVEGGLSAGTALCVYRVVQEGLTNGLRHASGAHVEVEVVTRGGCLEVRVTDDGGTSRGQVGSGTGLVGLRERVLLAGGTFAAGPRADVPGFRLEAVLPGPAPTATPAAAVPTQEPA